MKLMLFVFLLQNIIECHKPLQNQTKVSFPEKQICIYKDDETNDINCIYYLLQKSKRFFFANISPIFDKNFSNEFNKKHLFLKKTLKYLNTNNTMTVFNLYADIKNDFRKFVKLKFSDYRRTLKTVCFLRFSIVKRHFNELNKLCKMYFEFEHKKQLRSDFINYVSKKFDECKPKLINSEKSSLFWKKSNIFRQVTNSSYFPLTRLLLYYEIRKDIKNVFNSTFLNLKCNKNNIFESKYDKPQKKVCINLPFLCQMFFDFEHKKEFIFKIKNVDLWFLSYQNYTVHSDKVFENNNVFLHTR